MTVTLPGLVVSGRDDAELAAAAAAVKATIAFYGSTPAYRPVLELHGWGDLADELHTLSVGRREDKWTAMRDLVDDEVLATFAVVAGPGARWPPRCTAATTGWSTGSASTPPIPRRTRPLGARWSRPSPDTAGPPRNARPAYWFWESLSVTRSSAVVPRARSTAALAALVALALSACAAGSSGGGAAVSQGDPDACPGQVVDVVVSVGQWGDLVRTLGGACATVTTVVVVRRGRPARLRARHRRPRRLLETPTWSCSTAPATTTGPQDAVATSTRAPAVVSAAAVAGVAGPRAPTRTSGTTPTSVQEMSTAVSQALADLAGADASDYLAPAGGRLGRASCSPTRRRSRRLQAVAAGRTFAATETGLRPDGRGASGSPTRRPRATGARRATTATPRPAT